MADVDNTLPQWSTTSGSNKPAGTATVGTGWDDNLREIQGVMRRWLAHKGADIASAATADLGAVEGLFHDITGAVTITSFGTVSAGIWKVLTFEGALTLTYNATSLILPNATSITTAVGDVAIFASEGSGNWRCVSYVPVSGPLPFVDSSVVVIGSADKTKKIRFEVDGLTTATTRVLTMRDADFELGAATQAEQETATSLVAAVTPGRQQFHPSAIKAWCFASTSGTSLAGYNISSVTDTGTGEVTINFSTSFSSANYCVTATPKTTFAGAAAGALMCNVGNTGQQVGSVLIDIVRASDGAHSDPSSGTMVMCAGDQ